MKKTISYCLTFLGFSFFLSGLQGSLYFSPIPLPSFWFIIFTFYTFRKSLRFSLLMNIPHALVIASFSTLNLGLFLILINFFTISFHFIWERFHTNRWHMSLSAGGGYFLFLLTFWIFETGPFQFHWPPVLQWFGASLSTLIVAPFLISVLDGINKRIEYERIDTLENLRI